MDYEKLREIAKTIVVIPEQYRLVMESSIPKGNEKERCYIWEQPNQEDSRIEVVLDIITGQLTSMEIEQGKADEVVCTSSIEEAKANANIFLSKHAPDHSAYTWVQSKRRHNSVNFTYREEVGGLPLPSTGCEITVDALLHVIRYRKGGRDTAASKPMWPATTVDAEIVKEQVLSNVRMELTITSLHPSLYEVQETEPEYRLVYKPVPEHVMINAITGEDLFGAEHYVMPPSHPIVPNEGVEQVAVGKDGNVDICALETELGIDPELYILDKCEDDGDSIRYIYRLRSEEEEELEQDDLSVDGYMKRKWGEQLRHLSASFAVRIEKSSGRLMRFKGNGSETAGELSLSREQCWGKAEGFLRRVFPEYVSYLQLEVDQEESDRELREREFFNLPLYIKGIPIHNELVRISVSTSTGDILIYMGVSYEMIKTLEAYNHHPVLAAGEALDRYLEHVSIQLRWSEDKNEEPPVYRLLYEPKAVRNDQSLDMNRLKYIDACSGELIWEKK